MHTSVPSTCGPTLPPLSRAAETVADLWRRTLAASPTLGPTGPLAASQSPAGRQPHRPSRSRPSLPGRRSKRQGLAPRLSDPNQRPASGASGFSSSGPRCPFPPPLSQLWGTWPLVLSLAIEMRCRPRPWRLSSLPPHRCQLAAGFDPVLSRLGAGAPTESYRRGKAQDGGLPHISSEAEGLALAGARLRESCPGTEII